MKDLFLEFAKAGSMTDEDLASVLKVPVRTVQSMSRRGEIPRIPKIRAHRFDPLKMIDVFCAAPAARPGSLTIERHKTLAKPNGGYRKCL